MCSVLNFFLFFFFLRSRGSEVCLTQIPQGFPLKVCARSIIKWKVGRWGGEMVL